MNYFSDVKGKQKANKIPDDEIPNKMFVEGNADNEGEKSYEPGGDGLR